MNKKLNLWTQDELLSALDKQTPKKPALSGSGYFFICPTCDHFVERHEQSHGEIEIPYCKWCGQKFTWEDEAPRFTAELTSDVFDD